MNCTEFRTELEAALLTRQDVSSDVAEHGATCSHAECHQLWLDHVLLAPAIQAWQARESMLVVPQFRSVEPNPVVSPGRTEARPAASPPLRWGAVVLAGIALLSLISVFSVPQSRKSAAIARKGGTPAAGHEQIADGSDGDAAIRELGETYVHWLQNSTGQITETVDYVLVNDSDSGMPTESPEWIKSLEQTWQPVGESLRETFGDLLPSTPVDMGNAS